MHWGTEPSGASELLINDTLVNLVSRIERDDDCCVADEEQKHELSQGRL